jgi:uncharacterized membrane protein
MAKISGSAIINAPVEEVFAFVDDHNNTVKYMEGMVSWGVVGELCGVGTVFRGEMQFGPTKLTSEVVITELVPNEIIAWKSQSGPTNNGRWTIEPAGKGAKVTHEQEFELPGGVFGAMLAKTLEPIMRIQAERSLSKLKNLLEAKVLQEQP